MAREAFDIGNEALVVGSFYKQPDLYIEYGKTIRSKYDFYDESAKFLFDTFELYYTSFSQEVSEDKINIFMRKDDDRKRKYLLLGGYPTIQGYMEIADIDDFSQYYDTLKKFSLIRELDRKGFPISRILEHPKFDKIPSDKIIMSMRASLDKIQTVIGGQSDSVLLGSDMVNSVVGWRKNPAMGYPFPWDLWTYFFRGWRKGKLVIDGMLSNEGKSRRMSFLAAYVSLMLGEPVLVMVNEMGEEDIKAAMLTAVCNNPVFGFELKVPERNIVLGEYDSEEQYNQVLEVAKYFEEHTKIYFREMNSYSDDDIDHEVRKHVLGLGVKFIFYDTLKGFKTDNWETVKQTATKLKDLVSEFDIMGYATIQLTDDSLMINVFDFSSNNIANAKQLKHVVDHLFLEKRLDYDEYYNYSIYNEDWGGEMPLQNNKLYYGLKLDKNRAGTKGQVLCHEVDLDLNVWKECGLLLKNKKEKKSGKE